MGTKRQDQRVALWASLGLAKWPTLHRNRMVCARHVRSIPLNWQRPSALGKMDDVDMFDFVCDLYLYVFVSFCICCVYAETLEM